MALIVLSVELVASRRKAVLSAGTATATGTATGFRAFSVLSLSHILLPAVRATWEARTPRGSGPLGLWPDGSQSCIPGRRTVMHVTRCRDRH